MGDYSYLTVVFIMIAAAFTVLDICACIWLFGSFAEKRRAGNKIFTAACVILASGMIWVITNIFFFEQFCAKLAAVSGVISVTMYLLFRLRYVKALALSIIYYEILLTADYVALIMTGILTGAVFPEAAGDLWTVSDYVLFYATSAAGKALALGMIFCIKKMAGGRKADILTVREWCVLSAISFITIISVAAMVLQNDWVHYTSQPVDFIHVYIAAGIMLINFLGYYLIHSIVQREMQLREYAVFREKVKNEMAAYRSVSENLDRQKKRTHEYKNQLATISALAARGQYQELRAYIEKIESSLKTGTDAVDTNNVIVNAILNTKYRDAVGKGIVFVLKVNDLSELKIEEEDIVVILSNLLNNALEACEQCENKVIKLKLVLEGEQAVISVKNSMAAQPVVENGTFQTSKTDKTGEHGIGIRNVVETVEKYGGRYVIDYGKGEFQFSILMPNGLGTHSG